jgi:cytochrome c
VTGSAPPPLHKGRWPLILFGIAVGAVSGWLLFGGRPEAPPVQNVVLETKAPEQPIEHYLARADLVRGEAFFARCASCHTINDGGAHAAGPNLRGVMGSAIASRPGATYSPALSASGGSWDWETMSEFLRSPREFARGTRMTFSGIIDPQDRADVMLYMNAQGGALPAPAR